MIKINLLPPRPRKAIPITLPPLPWVEIGFGILLALVIGGVGSYWYQLSSEASRLEADRSRLQAELKTLEAAIAKGKAFRQKVLDLEKRLTAIEVIAKGQARPIYLLDALADAIPRDLWLSSVEERPQKDAPPQLRLAGAAFSSTAVADFMANLRASKKFKDVDLLVSRQDIGKTPRVVTFEIVCSFES